MNSQEKPFGKQSMIFNLWGNPIFRRYCRSRLRPLGLGVFLLIALILASFVFFISYTGSLRYGMANEDAWRTPLVPLLVLQAIILFFLGTGQVAGAMTAEADEGVLDYQRLAPMSPLAKVIGYLFGLPIREYVVCLATIPFTIWCVIKGNVPWEIIGPLYLTFFTSALLYHLTGLVAGTVVKNRRWAFLISIGAIFLLYTVVPQIAKFGLVYFKYLTLWPVLGDSLPYLIPKDAGAGLNTLNRLIDQATFFNLEVSSAAFTIFTQSFLIIVGIVMLWRRWYRSESHLLGKGMALGSYIWLQIVLLGNALPLIESGIVFPSKAFGRIAHKKRFDWQPSADEAVIVCGVYGLVSLMVIWLLTTMITPTSEGQLRGWRRAHKQNRKSLRYGSDASTAFGWVLCMTLIGIAGWWVFTNHIVESRWFPGQEIPLTTLAAYSLSFITGALGFHTLLEWKGVKTVGFCVLFVGVVPVMLAAIVASIADSLIAAAIWLASISPVSAPIFGSMSTIPISNLPVEIMSAIPRAFWFWQGIALLCVGFFVTQLRQSRREIAAKATER